MDNKLPERLKQLRAKRGISQSQLAEELGFANSYFGEVEMGRSLVSVSTLILLADFFNVTTDYLLGRG